METASQKYLSTRGGSYGFTFEEAILKGLASDGGLFIPEAIATPPHDWQTRWAKLPFAELAYEVLSLYISPQEIPASDLRDLARRSYSTFRHTDITPLRTLIPSANLHLLELFHGPTFAFKDVALQFVGNLFEYFLLRKNRDVPEEGGKRHHLTVIGATSGDTGSAAIYGLRGKRDVSVFILHPKGRVSPIQEAQMTTVLDANVHNLSVRGTFDDCQDVVKALFAHPELSASHNLGAVNSINWARILAQIVYYYHSYFALLRTLPAGGGAPIVRYVVPTGNFGNVLAGYYAKSMGLPIDRLVIATNENDILDRFFRTSRYEKHPASPAAATGGIPEDGVRAHTDGVKETHSPAMDILVSSNFERLLWYLAYENETAAADPSDEHEKRARAGDVMREWMGALKSTGTTVVSDAVLASAKRDFTSERVSDEQTVQTIRRVFTAPPSAPYILDPHSAVGVAAAMRLIEAAGVDGKEKDVHYVSLSTAHPAKFSHAVDLALSGVSGGEVGVYDFESMVRPEEFLGLEGREKRVREVARADVELVRRVVVEELEKEGVGRN